MVEADIVQPGNLLVALVALGSLFALIDIVLLVTAVTIRIDLLGFCTEGMAGFAGQIEVPAV